MSRGRRFELIQRDGYGKTRILETDSLEEMRRKLSMKTGESDGDDLFDMGGDWPW